MLMRKRTILAKIESAYGTDPTPTGAANAILVRNLTITPMQTDQASRDLIRAYLGNYENLPAAIHAMVEFEVEVAGKGTAGQAPNYGPLLRACAMQEKLVATDETGTCQVGSTSTTAVLRAALAQPDDFYNGSVIEITGGTGVGQRRLITDFVGATDVATVSKAWDSIPDATSQYAIRAQACYVPESEESGMESVTIYANVDGVLHELNGARGSVALSFNVLGIPVYKFRFLGLFVPVVDGALPTCDYSAFQKPLTVNNDNTSNFRIHGYNAAALQALDLDLANSVVFRSLVGSEKVLITDRKPAGSVAMEATTVAAKDWWTLVQSAATDELTLRHGTAAGNIVEVDAFAAQLLQPSYEDLDGVAMLRAGLVLVPSAGNDELAIVVR
jgi:hypothetical protein